MHILPQLRKLEEAFPEELVVLGVHSAKFPAEKETDAVRQAILRYDIRHPVVNDRDFQVWQRYAARAWPSLFFLDPEGKVLAKHEGEYRFEDLERFLRPLVEAYDLKGLLQRSPAQWTLERDKQAAENALAFPGKLLADEQSNRIFIADSGHHRIVVTSLDGEVQEIIGDGERGLTDGSFANAQFSDPQGMALDGETLYVADKENHALRKVDLVARTVETISGTGQAAMTSSPPGPAKDMPLRSPWDVTVLNGTLYIAMAGAHQLWSLDLASGNIGPFAGSGREGLSDCPLMQAWLAQPTGITHDGESRLYFADSETSAIRAADTTAGSAVQTLVGIDLFDFGDRDGIGSRVLLQHVQGVCYSGGALYITDTYNSKIKRVDPITKETATLFGGPEAGLSDGAWTESRLNEPSGVSCAKGKLYIADTNNHAIRVADLGTGEVTTLEIRGL